LVVKDSDPVAKGGTTVGITGVGTSILRCSAPSFTNDIATMILAGYRGVVSCRETTRKAEKGVFDCSPLTREGGEVFWGSRIFGALCFFLKSRKKFASILGHSHQDECVVIVGIVSIEMLK